jgi:hypothetical protein
LARVSCQPVPGSDTVPLHRQSSLSSLEQQHTLRTALKSPSGDDGFEGCVGRMTRQGSWRRSSSHPWMILSPPLNWIYFMKHASHLILPQTTFEMTVMVPGETCWIKKLCALNRILWSEKMPCESLQNLSHRLANSTIGFSTHACYHKNL